MADKPYRWIVFRTGLSEDSGRSRLQMPRFRLGPQPVIVGIPKSSELCSSYWLNLIRRFFSVESAFPFVRLRSAVGFAGGLVLSPVGGGQGTR